ncbi:MAG TPA: peptide-methionine (S)-S-oxide reductase MsrA [Gemmatimonadaceae bacterium]|nr:peptide-methionine (S)-S-oxide reductase MsrA [Gemmatimonadaceae bacterium]
MATNETMAPSSATSTATKTELATFGGGCFWCLDAVFRRLRGVERVVSGYAGGRVANPSYEQVCAGTTGHAEVVQLSFDPSVIGYRELLEVFFAIHDPTTRDRQGGDVGTQYRSIIFPHNAEQERAAREAIAELEREGTFDDPIVTEVVPLTTFYAGEAYHQDYYDRNSAQGYCRAVISPKVSKLRSKFAGKLKA